MRLALRLLRWHGEIAKYYTDAPSEPSESSDSKEKEVCSICLCKMTEDRVRVNSCGHFFHMECINEWLARRRICPMCRTVLI